MTYCLAWKDNENVFLVADSAVSSNFYFSDNDISSFGDVQEEKQGIYVSESALKVHSMHNKYLIGFAGNLEHIDEIYSMLDMLLGYGMEIHEALNMIANSVNYSDIEFLIGYVKDGLPTLIHFDGKNILEGDKFQVGSGVTNESWVYRNELMLNNNLNNPVSPRQSLASMVSVLQIYSLKENMMNIGVGGLVFGARINSDGIHWCEDTTYYFYRDQLTNYDLVTVIARDNNVFVLSSFNSRLLMFLGRANWDKPEKYQIDMINLTDEILTRSATNYFVFISMFYPTITLVDINHNLQNNLFRMYSKKDGIYTHYRFILTEELYDILTGKNFLSDEVVFFQWEFAHKVNYLSRKSIIEARGHEDLVEDYDDEDFI